MADRRSIRSPELPRLSRYSFDAAYVRRLVEQDPETERHFTKYFGDLLTLKLRPRLRSAVRVEDAKQETFVRVLTALKQKGGLTNPESLGSFVNSVCNNVLFELYRADARTTMLDEHEERAEEGRPSAEGRLIRLEERDRVRQALATLSRREQELLWWLFFEERDKDDICRELKVDRNYLRVLVHRAKARFRERFMFEDEVF